MTKEERKQLEKQRFIEMVEFESSFYQEGTKILAGVDEAGRGPLAGPVVAAAVILPQDCEIIGINDSKRLSEKKREALYDIITERAIAYGIGIVDNNIIDEINILESTKLAMKRAIEDLEQNPDHILIDGPLTLKDVDIPQTGIVKGDKKSISIAAASILAKVTRDRMMVAFHDRFPQYAFDRNKGYATKVHFQSLNDNGLCCIHRRSFLKSYEE
ncbi:MAG: ribonuclease HII [Anaerovoracaceae bacterium]|jgi:ribonuclease HII